MTDVYSVETKSLNSLLPRLALHHVVVRVDDVLGEAALGNGRDVAGELLEVAGGAVESRVAAGAGGQAGLVAAVVGILIDGPPG